MQMFLASAKAVPEEKRDWSPGGAATTTTWMVNHCAKFPRFIIASITRMEPVLDAFSTPDLGFDEAVANLENATDALCAFVATVPEEQMSQSITFRWAPMTVSQTLRMHHWNNTYHLGQVNYIQLLIGDREMHA